MIKKFPFLASVTRRVNDQIELTVLAEDEGQAYEIARRALQDFPDSSDEPQVTRCYISSREQLEHSLDDLQQKGPVRIA